MSSFQAAAAKVALVTGASRGIGRACALALARNGYDVVANYQSNKELAAEVVREIQEMGRQAMSVQADVSRAKDVDVMITTVMKEWGQIDVLVANAGVSEREDFETLEVEDWDRVLGTNLRGVFLCCQKVTPLMRHQGAGRMILLASQAGFTGGYLVGAHYVAAKAGVVALMKHLAKRLAPDGVLVNCVSPGIVDTEMMSIYSPELLNEMIGQVPLGRLATPEEVAHVVLFLAGEGSTYITGATIHVNGGIYMS